MLRTLLLIALFSYAHACTDPAANNVNSADPCTYDSYCAHGLPLTDLTEAPSGATSQCQPIEGCPDPNALNEDVTASIDDGSCQYDCFCKSGSGVGGLACTEEYAVTKSETADLDQQACEDLENVALPCPAGLPSGKCSGTFMDLSLIHI